MAIDPHTLEADFPEYSDTIRRLNEEDLEFKTQSDSYNRLDKQIRGLEERGVATDDQHFTTLKVQRAHMKDRLYRRIANNNPQQH